MSGPLPSARRVAASATLLLTLSLAAGPAAVAEQLPESEQGRTPAPGDELESNQALALDAAQYSRDMGVTQQEAQTVLESQAEAVAAIDRIATTVGDRFDGAWLETTTAVRGHVRIRGNPSDTQAKVAAGDASITIHWTNRALMPELREHAEATSAALARDPDVAGIAIDEARAEIVIWVDESRVPRTRWDAAGPVPEGASEPGATGLARARLALAEAGVPARIAWVQGGSQQGQRGGVSRTGCTVGFSIYWTSSGNRGASSAAHCGASAGDRNQLYSLTWNGTPTYQLRWVSQQYDQSGDIEVLTMASHTPQPNFFGQSAVTPTATTGTGTAYQGQYLCHRGKTSGYNCATVVSTAYAPTGNACPVSSCATVFVILQGINALCQGGDGGGPWFIGGSAYGIHLGHSDPRTCIYTPIARLANLGARVLT